LDSISSLHGYTLLNIIKAFIFVKKLQYLRTNTYMFYSINSSPGNNECMTHAIRSIYAIHPSAASPQASPSRTIPSLLPNSLIQQKSPPPPLPPSLPLQSATDVTGQIWAIDQGNLADKDKKFKKAKKRAK
jgi:hypothetical protein